MDIKQLRYFITIVDSGCNLQKASKNIHISQPALSQMIKLFETSENIVLFERSQGRLKRLTPAGKILYGDAMQLIEKYDYMIDQLREDANKLKGSIRIGIPPLVLSVVFTELMSKLIIENPDIHIQIVEKGAYELKKSLLLQEVDIAILLGPTMANDGVFEEVLLTDDELCAFMDRDHRLASESKIFWNQLHQQPIASFDETFMIRHQLTAEFKNHQIKPNISITSGSWDFLLRSVVGTNLITILPAPTLDCFPNKNITSKQFVQPVDWQILMCRNKKQVYSRVEKYIFKEVLNFFDIHN